MKQLEGVRQDAAAAVQSLSRQKGWLAVALITLALGIGANSALFTIFNAVLIRPLPYPQSERLLSLSESDHGVDLLVVPSPTYAEWSRSAGSFAALAAYSPARAVLRGAAEPEVVSGMITTASYFPAMGVNPEHGRVFSEEEDRPGGPVVVVLSHQLWLRMFGGDSTLVGRTVVLDDQPVTVVGIMPPSFTTTSGAQYWTPLRIGPVQPGTVFYYFIVGRLRPGASVKSARAELAALAPRLDEERPVDQRGRTAVVMTLQERRTGDIRPALLILLCGVGVLLLIASANVGNLLLARGARRQSELAVRRALGASRWQLVRYQLIESLVLSLAGALIALLITYVMVGPLVRLAPATVGRVESIEVDTTVLLFTFLIALITGTLFGLIPALEAGRAEPGAALSSGFRASRSPRQQRLARALIVFELATALVLLTCAGLLTRSFVLITTIDPGFRPRGVLATDINLPTRYSNASAAQFFAQLLERMRQLPGVESAALADVAPLGGASMSFSMRNEAGQETPPVDVIAISSTYLTTVGTPLLGGRGFDSEHAREPRVAIVNAKLSSLLYSGEDPVGRRINVPGDGGKGTTVVGVAKDVLQRELEAEARPALYVPVEQAGPRTRMSLLVRTSGDPRALRQPILQAVWSLDPTLPAPAVTALEQVLSGATAARRFSFVLLAIFALLAVTLAGVGLYGVLAYLVADRTREIGIRIALGAGPRRLIRHVVGHGMRLVFIGGVIGLGGSIVAVRLVRHLLFGVGVYDALAFSIAAAILAGVALAACWVPAWRAANVEPGVALRIE